MYASPCNGTSILLYDLLRHPQMPPWRGARLQDSLAGLVSAFFFARRGTLARAGTSVSQFVSTVVETDFAAYGGCGGHECE